MNFKVLYDADLIVNLDEKYRAKAPTAERLEKILQASFLTRSGRRVAEKALRQYVRDETDRQ
ncbi:MAG TPA: hypothetical protein ENG79_02035 [Desulfobacteraceae bacterium]|nr:hypothetical protein [Desulfobacteraceae bacterium]